MMFSKSADEVLRLFKKAKFDCSHDRARGHVRVTMPVRLWDGTGVEVFVSGAGPWWVSDAGSAEFHPTSLGIEPRNYEALADGYSLTTNGGIFGRFVRETDGLAEAAWAVAAFQVAAFALHSPGVTEER